MQHTCRMHVCKQHMLSTQVAYMLRIYEVWQKLAHILHISAAATVGAAPGFHTGFLAWGGKSIGASMKRGNVRGGGWGNPPPLPAPPLPLPKFFEDLASLAKFDKF